MQEKALRALDFWQQGTARWALTTWAQRTQQAKHKWVPGGCAAAMPGRAGWLRAPCPCCRAG
jgi:hypothetical protein